MGICIIYLYNIYMYTLCILVSIHIYIYIYDMYSYIWGAEQKSTQVPISMLPDVVEANVGFFQMALVDFA